MVGGRWGWLGGGWWVSGCGCGRMGGSSRCSFISFFICEQNNAMLCLSVTPVLTLPIKPGEETIQIKRANVSKIATEILQLLGKIRQP